MNILFDNQKTSNDIFNIFHSNLKLLNESFKNSKNEQKINNNNNKIGKRKIEHVTTLFH